MKIIKFILQVTGAVALLGIAGFCVFGFLASYELSSAAARLPWQIGYGTVGLIALGLAGWLVLARPR